MHVHKILVVAIASTLAWSGSASARFVSVDPVTPNTNTGDSFNRYSYAADNPYKFTDPDGRTILILGPSDYRKDMTAIKNDVKGSTPNLGNRIQTLENSNQIHIVAPVSWNKTEHPDVTVTVDPSGSDVGHPASSITFMDATGKLGPAGSPMGTPGGVFAHEVGSHAYEMDQGTDVPVGREVRANRVEREYLQGKATNAAGQNGPAQTKAPGSDKAPPPPVDPKKR